MVLSYNGLRNRDKRESCPVFEEYGRDENGAFNESCYKRFSLVQEPCLPKKKAVLIRAAWMQALHSVLHYLVHRFRA